MNVSVFHVDKTLGKIHWYASDHFNIILTKAAAHVGNYEDNMIVCMSLTLVLVSARVEQIFNG